MHGSLLHSVIEREKAALAAICDEYIGDELPVVMTPDQEAALQMRIANHLASAASKTASLDEAFVLLTVTLPDLLANPASLRGLADEVARIVVPETRAYRAALSIATPMGNA
jgi:hypothetical protein